VASKRPVTKEDLWTLKTLHGGSLSPDGGNFVFSARSVRKDHKGYDSHLYVAGTRDGGLRQFTNGKKGDSGALYSPGGTLIAFMSKRGHYPGIHILPTGGGEARTLVEKDGGFGDLSFSPDGRRILCTFCPNDPIEKPEAGSGAAAQSAKKGPRAQKTPQNQQSQATQAADPDAPPPKREPPLYRHIDRLLYRGDGMGFYPLAEPQVWIFDVITGEGTQITTGKRGAAHPAFSPDGRWVAFVRNTRPDPDLEPERSDLFVVSARGGRPRLVPTPPGPVACPRFSPDGRRIAYIGHDDVQNPWYEQPRVWVVPVDGRGRARCLARRFDQPAYDATITDIVGGPGVLPPHWSPDGRWVYFMSSRHGSTGLYRVRARGGEPELLTPDRMHLQSVCVAADCRTAAGIVSTPTMPPEAFVFDLRTGVARRLTTLNKAWTDEIEVRRPQRVVVRSTEKTRVEAWLLTPPGFNARRKYPAILEIHGGPQTQYGYSFFHEMQLLAARGFVVMYSNPRGSQGYGRAFAEAIKGDWGNRDFADVLAVTDYLESLPYVNGKRIGVTGGSYGGYMTNWVLGHTRRFKAAVTQRSVVDFVPFFGSSDIGFRFHHTLGAYPWEDPEAYRRQSPLTYAKNIRTPLLILHNEGDLRCNIEQAENLFATLKILGRKVEFVRFPGEPHGLSRGGRPDRRVARLEKIVTWFERHL
jgi:dipeptidyl aminopeptidase/acylaminoacyl peptidase